MVAAALIVEPITLRDVHVAGVAEAILPVVAARHLDHALTDTDEPGHCFLKMRRAAYGRPSNPLWANRLLLDRDAAIDRHVDGLFGGDVVDHVGGHQMRCR